MNKVPFVIVKTSADGLSPGAIIEVVNPNYEEGVGYGHLLDAETGKRLGSAQFRYVNVAEMTRKKRAEVLRARLKELRDQEEKGKAKADILEQRAKALETYETDEEELLAQLKELDEVAGMSHLSKRLKEEIL